jgi:lipopolysaccharide/colanic/teichoic acid biosynthesis glycosyltransferase
MGRYPWTGSVGERPLRGLGRRALKRLLDAVVAGVVLVLLSVFIAIIALAIKLESRGPVLYRARRVGLGGRELRMLKFRRMRLDSAGPVLTGPDDQRLTRIGRFLGRTKLDEIPQLWNVLTGSMSLVGPRPQDPSFVALRKDDYERILRVKPGVTGLYQLAFARESELLNRGDHVADYVRRLLPLKTRFDLLYVAHQSVLMDLRILAWTAITVLFRKEVAVNRSTGRLSLRRRPRHQLVPEPREAEGA